jgi:hypothetical protein
LEENLPKPFRENRQAQTKGFSRYSGNFQCLHPAFPVVRLLKGSISAHIKTGDCLFFKTAFHRNAGFLIGLREGPVHSKIAGAAIKKLPAFTLED